MLVPPLLLPLFLSLILILFTLKHIWKMTVYTLALCFHRWANSMTLLCIPATSCPDHRAPTVTMQLCTPKALLSRPRPIPHTCSRSYRMNLWPHVALSNWDDHEKLHALPFFILPSERNIVALPPAPPSTPHAVYAPCAAHASVA